MNRPLVRQLVRATVLTASVTLVAGCGSSGTGTACSNLSADLKGIYSIEKRHLHGSPSSLELEASMSPSERQTRDELQVEAREALAACRREGRA